MPAASLHRLNILRVAARLFRRQGYSRTGLKDILSESGAPKGSLYHYFPEGKEQLGVEALKLSADKGLETLRALRQQHSSAPALLLAFGELLAGWMEQSAFRDGCPLATTVLEAAPESDALRQAAGSGLAAWQQVLEEQLLADGADAHSAARLAGVAIAAMEGSLIQARVEQSAAPIKIAAGEIAMFMELRLKG